MMIPTPFYQQSKVYLCLCGFKTRKGLIPLMVRWQMLKITRTFPFFHLVLSLLGSQSYLGCCYLEAKPFGFFFHLVLSLLGSQSSLGCCYLKAEPFFIFYFFIYLYIFSSGSVSLGELVNFRPCVFILKHTNFENESQQS